MKVLNFILGLVTGVVCTYFFLTRVWWPDVRLPGTMATVHYPASATPLPTPVTTLSIPLPGPEVSPTEPVSLPSPIPSSPEPMVADPSPNPGVPQALPSPAAPPKPAEPPILTSDLDKLRARGLLIPVTGVERKSLSDNFDDDRAGRHHEAIDILAPRGTPVVAVDDGHVEKLFTSERGGLTIYQFDPQTEYCYYYAHLNAYAADLVPGKVVKKGEVIGYVGTTGNAPPQTPHLHFTIFRLGPTKRWWEGTAINAYPVWSSTTRTTP
jgi:murein DD-endopeptidase MepM/ murein hydrolase activator NlpD